LPTEAAAAFLQAPFLGCSFLGLLGGTDRFLGHELLQFCFCFPGCLLLSFSWFLREKLASQSMSQLAAGEISPANGVCTGQGESPRLGTASPATVGCTQEHVGHAHLLDKGSGTSDSPTAAPTGLRGGRGERGTSFCQPFEALVFLLKALSNTPHI